MGTKQQGPSQEFIWRQMKEFLEDDQDFKDLLKKVVNATTKAQSNITATQSKDQVSATTKEQSNVATATQSKDQVSATTKEQSNVATATATQSKQVSATTKEQSNAATQLKDQVSATSKEQSNVATATKEQSDATTVTGFHCFHSSVTTLKCDPNALLSVAYTNKHAKSISIHSIYVNVNTMKARQSHCICDDDSDIEGNSDTCGKEFQGCMREQYRCFYFVKNINCVVCGVLTGCLCYDDDGLHIMFLEESTDKRYPGPSKCTLQTVTCNGCFRCLASLRKTSTVFT